jgi:hypothetical protein
MNRCCCIILIALLLALPRAEAQLQANLRTYHTPYYIIHTDLPEEHVPEVLVRMNRMAEEYQHRTREFSGRIQQRLPFYLYQHERDYLAAGGVPGSAGAFTGEMLMAVAGRRVTDNTWHTIQHEGFHQFANAVIGGNLPIWVNEGLAEYFGEAIFTGDGFITGVIPPWRLQRVQTSMQRGDFMPIERMMMLTHAQWNENLTLANYDQTWAMVHFLAHAEGGRYQPALTAFMHEIARGHNWEIAWRSSFGDAAGFEQRWQAWWMDLPENPTAELYRKATVATLTSFLARATAQRQSFDSFDAFHTAARAGELHMHPDDWIPPSLLEAALKDLQHPQRWTLEGEPDRGPRLAYALEDGSRIIGVVQVQRGRVSGVATEVDHLPRILTEVRQLLEEGRKSEARTRLQAGMRQYPQSSSIPEASELLRNTR